MRAGVSHVSQAEKAVWTAVAGGWDANYPLANLSDLKSIRSPSVGTAAAAASFSFVLPSALEMDFFALVHHNAPAGSTMRLRLSAGTDPLSGTIHDSTAMPIWPAGGPTAGYLATRPYRLDAPVTARSGRVDLSAGSAPWEIGGFEIGSFWSWTDVAVDRGIGVDSQADVVTIGGADFSTRNWSPRIISGNRNVIDQLESETTLMDFHRSKGLSEPFVWVWDMDDPATWVREALLVRNATLPPGNVFDYEAAKMAFSFVEHLG